MMKASEIKENLLNNRYDNMFIDLYEDESLITYQNNRYTKAIEEFIKLYDDQDIEIYSVAGRSEVGGNHTDHQHGCVLATSINLDAIAMVTPQKDIVKIVSDDLDIDEININDLSKRDGEEGTSESLIRGVLSKLKEMGYKIGGFKAFVTSDVLMGAGLSSSAAFEGLIGTIVSGLYNAMEIDMVTIAKVGQYAENVYFGKPCGLMDQCACAVGGLISIDFNDTANPIVNHVDVDFSKFNHSLCIVDTKGSHADLTDEYAAIPIEMKKVAKFFDKEVLREVDENEFYENISDIREACGDRAVLRALHFFNENKRVEKLVNALTDNDFDMFKKYIKESGDSSYKYLQNVYLNKDPHNQAVSLALAVSEVVLKNHGVCRVHGGGFAGTIQAFVEDNYVEKYKNEIEKIFGKGSCHVLKIRKYGGTKVLG